MLGPQDLWIALALGVFFFGSKKLPELSRSLGQAMSEFKKGVATGAQAGTKATIEHHANDASIAGCVSAGRCGGRRRAASEGDVNPESAGHSELNAARRG